MIIKIFTPEQHRYGRATKRDTGAQQSVKARAMTDDVDVSSLSTPIKKEIVNFPMNSPEMLKHVDDEYDDDVLLFAPMLWAAKWWLELTKSSGSAAATRPRGTDAEVRDLLDFFRVDTSLLIEFAESELGEHFDTTGRISRIAMTAEGELSDETVEKGLKGFCDKFFGAQRLAIR